MKSFLLLFLPILLVAGKENPIASEEKNNATLNEGEEKTLATSGFVFDRYPSLSFPESHHWLIEVTLLDSDECTLEFEDGSVWKINSYDRDNAFQWRVNDSLTVTQNHRLFSNYDYRIINLSDHSSVEANLLINPIEMGPYTRSILSIDFIQKQIVLSDHTHWEISSFDILIFKDWTPADIVIIGINSDWNSSSEALLINAHLSQAVRAKRVN